MAKSDELIARIDADIARLKGIEDYVENYAHTHGNNVELISIINSEILEFQKIRDYVTQSGEASAPKPKRGRKKKAPGLPADDSI